MNLPFGVIDSDGHINEPEDELRTYIEGPYGEIKNSIHRFIPNASGAIGGGILATHSSFDTYPRRQARRPRTGGFSHSGRMAGEG